MSQNVHPLVAAFQQHADTDNGWRGEFWGKWFTSAVLAYQYDPTPEHRATLDDAVGQLLKTASPSGDIDTYDAAHRGGDWDVWTRKYVLLGLLAYYDLTHSADALSAAVGVGKTLLRDFGPGKASLQDASLSLVGGLSSSSVLEPICLLYQRTGETRFLDFANYIVRSWQSPSKVAPAGMHLIEDAMAGVAPVKMVAPKAYEMMSCYEGLCELYRCGGDRRYLQAVVHFAQTVRQQERMIDGSASNQELWCRGAVTQTAVLEQPQETCVTTTWIKLCAQLLRLTADTVWADEIENSVYNALAGAQTPQGDWWSYFTPLAGQRVPSLAQYAEIGLSCCVANGPRSLLLVPRLAVMADARGPVVNLYVPGRFAVDLPGGETATITQTTEYPRNGTIELTIDPGSNGSFVVSLRIPAWSQRTQLTVNGEPVACTAGTYARIHRVWSRQDKIELTLDMRGRAVQSPGSEDQFAVMRGPLLLAFDSRLLPPREVDVWLSKGQDGYVDLKPATNSHPEVWLAFDVPFEVKPYHFFQHHIEMLPMCDFASAGNDWGADNLYRTWIPQPLYLKDLYPADTWKLMYPGESRRPQIPRTA
jgi:DUF1680 family protein